MNPPWTRDEVILGLDVLFSMDTKNFSVENEAIIELSKLLNSLPLIPLSERDETFRNPAGVSNQLSRFWGSLKREGRRARVNALYYVVYEEFRDNLDDLKKIATAIRGNSPSTSLSFPVNSVEGQSFPEGKILFFLHHNIEYNQCMIVSEESKICSICGFNPQTAYHLRETARFLDPHLLVPPQDMRPEMRFSGKDFITVCPNCHQVLHQYRPWRSRSQCEQILKTLG